MLRLSQNIKDAADYWFQAEKYELAVAEYTAVLDFEEDWAVRSKLAEALACAGEVNKARHQYMYIAEKCPQISLRRAAWEKLKALSIWQRPTRCALSDLIQFISVRI